MTAALHKFEEQSWLRTVQKTGVTMLVSLLAMVAVAQQIASVDRQGELLDESEYRTEIEEVIVTGKEPEWRRQELEEQEWRPEKFELPKDSSPSRMQWLPAYSKDERDNYNGVRDRMGEKADIKLFEWKF